MIYIVTRPLATDHEMLAVPDSKSIICLSAWNLRHIVRRTLVKGNVHVAGSGKKC
jgi:hypothetical protein